MAWKPPKGFAKVKKKKSVLDKTMSIASKADDLPKIKDDVVLLMEEAQEIRRELEELHAIAVSLMERQKRVVNTINGIRSTLSID